MPGDLDTRNHSLQAAIVISLVAGLAACAPEPDEPEDPFVPVLESEHLRIGTSLDVLPCMGFVDMWEAQVEALEDILGVTRDFAWLYLYRDEESPQITVDCGKEPDPSRMLAGCWADPVVRSKLSHIPHELVHAWTATASDHPLPVLQEGIAERMAGTVPRHRWDGLTVDDLLMTTPPPSYEPAQHFVAWLMDVHGAETFMKLYTSTSRGMSETQLTAAFESVLGTTPAELVLAYKTSSRDYYPAMGGAACGHGPAIPWRDDAATWPAGGSCEDGPFIGFEDRSGWWQIVTIEVAIPGQYVLDVGDRVAAMTRCLTAPADASGLPALHDWLSGDWQHLGATEDAAYVDWDWHTQVLELDAGTYEVWVERSQDNPALASDMTLVRL